MQVIFVLVGFLASAVGCICGIGGGVIIKPVLDAFGAYSAATISFMSGCIVLSMTCYSVLKGCFAREFTIDKRAGIQLGCGAAVGGVLGKLLFDWIKMSAADNNVVGAVQSAVLFAIVLGALIYMLCRKCIVTLTVTKTASCVAIGLVLGMLSSFLGIGGGPINLVVLSYFFSMEAKCAAQNSLFIILLSQSASLLLAIFTRSVPIFPVGLFGVMVFSGILGGVVGRKINKKMDSEAVSRLLNVLIVIILIICVYNFCRYCQ